MLSYAYQNLQQKNYEKMLTESFENVHDLFAAILANGITTQLKRGLSREYIEKQENLSVVRGKINLIESIHLKLRNNRKIACCFDELSENHYMNQILKTTALCLIKENSVKRANKDALKNASRFFSEIEELAPLEINWKKLHYHRNNSSYRMLMNICYLVLHELLLTTEEGKQKLAAFFDEQQMSRLYEKFILEYYKKHFPQFRPSSRIIKWNASGTIDFLPEMKTDIMLIDDKNKKKLIIDAKYWSSILQNQYNSETIRSNHLYQIFSYVKNEDKDNTGLVDGMLLYAKTDNYRIQNINCDLNGNRISVKTLDLSNDFSLIENQLNSLINDWAGS